MNILLCEDEANIATISRLVLEQVGRHNVTWVTDGDEALAQGLTQKYDLILLDDMMPKMSGVAVCTAYKNSGQVTAPVIFLSANPQDAHVDELRPVAIGYIPKPFDPMKLCEQIENIFKSSLKKAV
jgi:DNA-binding response OmpR family regulator